MTGTRRNTVLADLVVVVFVGRWTDPIVMFHDVVVEFQFFDTCPLRRAVLDVRNHEEFTG